MSGREKPLILQNGMPIPQEYDKDLGDWTEYSNEHIKAIKAELALVKAELQTIKANQLSGDQKVQLSGTIAETTVVVNAHAITDTTWKTTEQIPAIRTPKMFLSVMSTLDQPVVLRPAVSGLSSGASVGFFKDQSNAPIELTIPASMSRNFSEIMIITSTELPILEYLQTVSFRLHYQCKTAPTSGSLTVHVVRGE